MLKMIVPLLVASAAIAGEPGYRLHLDPSLHEGRLTLAPSIDAPVGARLRYELKSDREGAAGRSSTSQGGALAVGESGSARLSILTFSVAPEDRYTVTVKVFDGARLVAERRLQVPQP